MTITGFPIEITAAHGLHEERNYRRLWGRHGNTGLREESNYRRRWGKHMATPVCVKEGTIDGGVENIWQHRSA
jgi:hypothetical protein